MEATPLERLLTSRARARVLQLFAVFNEDCLRFREIQRRVGVGSRSLQNELKRLEGLGLIEKEGKGHAVRYRARTAGPAWLPVWRTIASLAQPREVLAIVLADLAVSAGFIYGSVARGDARPDSDIDVFLIGEGINEIELARRTNEAGALLGREINVMLYTPEELRTRLRAGNPYVLRVLRQPKIWIIGNEHENPAAA